MNKVKKYTCFVYGEGRRDKNFLISLIGLDKFKYHTSKWHINYGNASGGEAMKIIDKCRKEVMGIDYDLIICFIDLDKLKTDYPDRWEDRKEQIESKYEDLNFVIIWQRDNAEEEYIRVLGNLNVGKHKLNSLAKKKVKKFINSDFWKRILNVIQEREKDLERIRRSKIYRES